MPRTGPFAIEIVLKVKQNPAPFQNRNSIGNPVLQVSLVPPKLSKWLFPASLVPPWCLADCPIDPFLPFSRLASCPNGSFLPLWCFPGASQASQLILSCLAGASESFLAFPGASQAVQMVLSCLPGASLSKGIQSVLSSRPWRPPQDLPRTRPFAIEIVLKVRQNPAPFQNRQSCATSLPGASLVPPRQTKWLFPASLVPRRLSN